MFVVVVFVLVCVCKDKLEVRYKLDSGRDAEVLRSRVRGLANGQLHAVSIRRLADSVSVQVSFDFQSFVQLTLTQTQSNCELNLTSVHTKLKLHPKI